MRIHSGTTTRWLLAVVLLAAAAGATADRASVMHGPSARFASLAEGAASSDASVTERVRTKLASNSNTRDLHIYVDTKNRVVRLRGKVWTREERDLAELLARNTEAVAQVRNDLVVRGRTSR